MKALFPVTASISLACCAVALAQQGSLWDIGATGRFDATDTAYEIREGVVVVDWARSSSRCPTGLGGLASGRPNVREIRLLFACPTESENYLHVLWNPGESGQEQFEVIVNGAAPAKSELVDAAKAPDTDREATFPVRTVAGANTLVLKHLSGDGLRFKALLLDGHKDGKPLPARLLKYPDRESFEKAIGQPAIELDSPHVMFLAPTTREKAARIVFPYLVKAYDELYAIVGVHTHYTIIVYAFPAGNSEGWGGTGNCTVEYGDSNLDLDKFKEWTAYGVPHVSGYIEEMAHSFVQTTGIQFGWEMVGWNLGVKATQKVASNPIFLREVQEVRRDQIETLRRYKAGGNTFPRDLPANQCDRIHAALLFQAEQRYGQSFWRDFFHEVRATQPRFAEAMRKSGDEQRNSRYQATLDCFDKLPKVQFRKMLQDNGISPTTDVRALHPEEKTWNRKMQ